MPTTQMRTKRRRQRPPAPPTLPMALVAAEMAKLLGRGAMVNTPTKPAFYLPLANLSGSVKALAEIYKPFEQWVLLDASTAIAISSVLPLDAAFPRVTAWEGATPADVAAAIARDNQQLAAQVMRHW